MIARHAARLGLVLLCAGTACGQDIAELIAELNHADAKRRVAAYRTLSRSLPRKAVPQLADALPRFGFSGQNYGAIILSRYPFPRVRSTLRKFLDCGVPFLELTSAVVLARNHDKKVEGRIIDKIITALGRPGVAITTRATMVRRITAVSTAPVRDAVRKLLVPGVHVSILAAALDHLSREDAEVRRTGEVVDTLLDSQETKGTARGLCAAFQVQRGGTKHVGTLAKTGRRLRGSLRDDAGRGRALAGPEPRLRSRLSGPARGQSPPRRARARGPQGRCPLAPAVGSSYSVRPRPLTSNLPELLR